MNALVLSDLHAHNWARFATPLPTGRNSRFQHLLDVLGQAQTVLEREPVSDLLILGDLLHRRHFINFRLWNTMFDAIVALAARVQATTLVVGNHDWEDPTTHGLHAYSAVPGIRVVETPQVVPLADGDALFAVPYLYDAAQVAQAFERAPATLPVVAHYAAEGVPLETEYWLESPLKLGECARFPWVVFGHVHKPSAQLDGRVQYVGAPLHFDFGDHGPRYMLRIRGAELTRLPTRFPQFLTATWPRVPVPPPDGGFVRVQGVPLSDQPGVQAQVEALGWLGVQLDPPELPPTVRGALARGLQITPELLTDYARRQCPDDPAAVPALVELGTALYNEAQRL